MEPARLQTCVFQEVFQKSEFTPCVIITFQVMAVSGVSPRNPDTVGAVSERSEYKLGTYPCRARYPNNPDIRGILESAYSCQVSSTVAAPVTQKGRNLWMPLVHH